MGGTYEGLFEKPVEVALKHELNVAFSALIDFDFSCVAVSPDCFLADIKPGYNVFKKDYRFSAKGKSWAVSLSVIAGTSCPFLNQREMREDCCLEVRLVGCYLFHRLIRLAGILQSRSCR